MLVDPWSWPSANEATEKSVTAKGRQQCNVQKKGAGGGARGLLSPRHWGRVDIQELMKHREQGQVRCVLFCESGEICSSMLQYAAVYAAMM